MLKSDFQLLLCCCMLCTFGNITTFQRVQSVEIVGTGGKTLKCVRSEQIHQKLISTEGGWQPAAGEDVSRFCRVFYAAAMTRILSQGAPQKLGYGVLVENIRGGRREGGFKRRVTKSLVRWRQRTWWGRRGGLESHQVPSHFVRGQMLESGALDRGAPRPDCPGQLLVPYLL